MAASWQAARILPARFARHPSDGGRDGCPPAWLYRGAGHSWQFALAVSDTLPKPRLATPLAVTVSEKMASLVLGW